MNKTKHHPIVFGGPSLRALPQEIRDLLDIRPPVRAGDLEQIKKIPNAPVLITDGVFSQNMAISPTECREFIKRNGMLLGASSMGALRAAELWKEGMIGIGEIFTMYQLGFLNSDADVAVAYMPETYEEVSLSLVHLYAILQGLEVIGLIEPAVSRKLIKIAREFHFMERYPFQLSKAFSSDLSPEILDLLFERAEDPVHHPKIRDANMAISYILSNTWVSKIPVLPGSPVSTRLSGQLLRDYRICKACSARLPASSIFCIYCASDAHEMQ